MNSLEQSTFSKKIATVTLTYNAYMQTCLRSNICMNLYKKNQFKIKC